MSGSVLELNASPQMDPKLINNDIDGVKRCVLIFSLFQISLCRKKNYCCCWFLSDFKLANGT